MTDRELIDNLSGLLSRGDLPFAVLGYDADRQKHQAGVERAAAWMADYIRANRAPVPVTPDAPPACTGGACATNP